MNLLRSTLSAALLLGFPFLSNWGQAQTVQALDRVIASVNGSVVTESAYKQRVEDLKRVYSTKEGPTQGRVPPMPAVQRRALDDLIDEELMIQHMGKEASTEWAGRQAERTVDMQISELKKSMGEEEFMARLAVENQSVEEFRKALVADRTRQFIVDQARRTWLDEYLLTPTSQAQVDKYLEDHPDVLDAGAAPEVQFVFLRIPPDVEETAKSVIRDRAVKLLAKARVGESFDDLVQQYSQHEQSKSRNGALDLVSPTSPFPEFAPLFDLDAGVIYPDVLEIPGWFCIAKVKSKQSIFNVVRRTIALEKQKQALEDMRKEATIIYDKNLFPGDTP